MIGALLLLTSLATPPGSGLPWFPPAERPAQVAWERGLNAVPDPARLRGWHDLLGSEPHVAGTPGDRLVIERLASSFEAMGLAVERHEFTAYLAEPLRAAVEIVRPVVMALPLRERPLDADPATGHEGLDRGWNAYSGSGDVTAGVVYANYGTKQDFATLAELGVEVRGRIVIARYGRNYRGFKARFAEDAGAAGLIIYTDPQDSGYGKGIPYPEGGWANETSIQRGSILTLDWPGDPLTPFAPATAGAARLDPDEVALPRIPVQPVGWRAASEIMSRMRGAGVPEGWQGGLPFAYRVDGGDDLRVRLMVEQRRALRGSANVVASLPGAREPQRSVILGCHHDAWGFGASDPLAGTIVLLECARSFAEAARRGRRPDRTILFAAWGAEEHGIIGSVEWCETHRDELLAGAVAYVNLDMAAMGPRFGASADPALEPLIAAAARAVPQARAPEATVYESWTEGLESGPPSFGSLGGGSDHVGFYCHLGVPACGLGGRGGPGTAYHSNYDTLNWYRQVVGDDYEPAVMLARLANVVAARLAAAPLLPLDLRPFAGDLRRHVAALRARAGALDLEVDLSPLDAAIDRLDTAATVVFGRLEAEVEAGRVDAAALERINGLLVSAGRAWLHEPGLPQRPWYRNLYAATDPESGYAAWMLPALRHAVERRDAAGVADAQQVYVRVLESLEAIIAGIETLLAREPGRFGGD